MTAGVSVVLLLLLLFSGYLYPNSLKYVCTTERACGQRLLARRTRAEVTTRQEDDVALEEEGESLYFYLSWFADYYVSKYEKRHLPFQADDALSGLERLNGSGGLDVLGSGGNLPTIIPGLVILWGGACRALLWTCDLFHFINCGLQSRITFWTEAISQAIADLCVWLFDLFYCLSNCGALYLWPNDLL